MYSLNFFVLGEILIQTREASFDSLLVESGPPPMELSSGDYIFFYNSAEVRRKKSLLKDARIFQRYCIVEVNFLAVFAAFVVLVSFIVFRLLSPLGRLAQRSLEIL